MCVAVLLWVIKESELPLPRSKFAIAKTAFSQLIGRMNKADFVIGLIDGFGNQLLSPAYKEILSQNVSEKYSSNLNCIINNNYYRYSNGRMS